MGSYSGDGIRVVRDAGAGRVARILLVAAAAVAVVTAALVLLIRHAAPDAAPPAPGPVAHAPAAPPATTGAAAPAQPARDAAAGEEPGGRAVDRIRARRRAAAAAGEAPKREIDAADAIAYLRSRGVREGIAAFEPPGTDPPKPGIIVPDDFPLPEGYVRHYQSDDDGNQLPPILMFHPDYEFVGDDGQPIALPEDLVVTPDLAPPGLPIEMLDVPAKPARPAPAP